MRFPHILFCIYLAVFTICAISPHDRTVWFAENLPMWIILGLIFWISKYHQFSNTAYGMMFFLLILHTIGSHYTFARVPFGWVTDTFDFERNHYDRLAHFTVGFYAYPLAEIAASKKLVRPRWLLHLLAVLVILAIAGAYEIFEWGFALMADPDAGIAVLGSQGDEWDAQKDMLADTLGAIFAIIFFAFQNKANRDQS